VAPHCPPISLVPEPPDAQPLLPSPGLSRSSDQTRSKSSTSVCVTKVLTCGLINSRLDYCNSLLHAASESTISCKEHGTLSGPENPTWVQISGTYLLRKPSYSQLYAEIATFRYHGNRGRSGASLNDTMKLADLENPQFGTRMWDMSPMQAELLPFCLNTQICFTVTIY